MGNHNWKRHRKSSDEAVYLEEKFRISCVTIWPFWDSFYWSYLTMFPWKWDTIYGSNMIKCLTLFIVRAYFNRSYRIDRFFVLDSTSSPDLSNYHFFLCRLLKTAVCDSRINTEIDVMARLVYSAGAIFKLLVCTNVSSNQCFASVTRALRLQAEISSISFNN